MDDTTQDPQMQQQNPPPAPVGGLNKEAGPVAEMPVAESLQPSEKVPELSPEVEQAGVEVSRNHEVPDLTMHDKNAGLSHAPSIAPIPTGPTGLVDIDITEAQAREEVKTNSNPKESRSWVVLERLKMVQRKLFGGGH